MLNMFYAIGETQLTSTYNFSTLLGVVSCWVAVLGPDLRSSTVIYGRFIRRSSAFACRFRRAGSPACFLELLVLWG